MSTMAQRSAITRSSGEIDAGLTADAAASRPDYPPSADPASDYARERRAMMRHAGYFFGGAMVVGMATALVKHLTSDAPHTI